MDANTANTLNTLNNLGALSSVLSSANDPASGRYGFTVQQSKGSWAIWVIVALVICCLCFCCLISSGMIGGYYYYNKTPAEKFTVSEVGEEVSKDISMYWYKLKAWFTSVFSW